MLRLLTEQTPFLDHIKSESVRCTLLVTRIYDRMFNFPSQLNTIMVYYGSEIWNTEVKYGLSFINTVYRETTDRLFIVFGFLK